MLGVKSKVQIIVYNATIYGRYGRVYACVCMYMYVQACMHVHTETRSSFLNNGLGPREYLLR